MSDAGEPVPSVIVLIPKQLRLDWLDLMAFDPTLSNCAFRIAAVIGYHFNKHTGRVFLRQNTIAEILNVSERTVFSGVMELERRGYMIIERREFGTIARKTKDGP
jgi:hypothetical protein